MNRRKFLSGLFALPVAAAITINTKLAIFEYAEPKTLASIGIKIADLDALTRQILNEQLGDWINSTTIRNQWIK